MSRTPIPLPEGAEEFLGKINDTEMARKYGVSRPTAVRWRKEAGIPPVRVRGRPVTPLPDGAEELLGQIPDADLARKYGVCTATAARWRRAAGLPKAPSRNGPGRPPIPLPEGAEEFLGKISDTALANKYGVSKTVAARWREEAGIAKVPRKRGETVCPSTKTFDKYPGIRERLGTVPDAVLADEYGISREWVRRLRSVDGIPSYQHAEAKALTAKIIPLLAEHRDSEIRHITGATYNFVQAVRYQEDVPEPPRVLKYEEALKKAEPYLGTMSDRKVGQMFNIPDSRVHAYRVSLGIEPYQDNNRYNPLDTDLIRKRFEEGKNDVEIAVELGSSAHTILQKRYEMGLKRKRSRSRNLHVDEAYVRTQILQKRDDTDIAAETGCSANYVAKIRRDMGILKHRKRLPWDDIIPLMGTMPDRELGAMFHTAGATICMKRNRLGIPSYKEQQGS